MRVSPGTVAIILVDSDNSINILEARIRKILVTELSDSTNNEMN